MDTLIIYVSLSKLWLNLTNTSFNQQPLYLTQLRPLLGGRELCRKTHCYHIDFVFFSFIPNANIVCFYYSNTLLLSLFTLKRNSTNIMNIRILNQSSMLQSSPLAPNPWKLQKMSKHIYSDTIKQNKKKYALVGSGIIKDCTQKERRRSDGRRELQPQTLFE